MVRARWWGLSLVLCAGAAGCEGCLNLDDYTLVPPGFDVSGGGGAGAGSDGGGGAGGDVGCEQVAGAFRATATTTTTTVTDASCNATVIANSCNIKCAVRLWCDAESEHLDTRLNPYAGTPYAK